MNELQDAPPTENSLPNYKREFANLHDSYREFQHYCAFYCQSTSVMLRRYAYDLDADCLEGIERFAQMIVDKADEIDVRLKRLMNSI